MSRRVVCVFQGLSLWDGVDDDVLETSGSLEDEKGEEGEKKTRSTKYVGRFGRVGLVERKVD